MCLVASQKQGRGRLQVRWGGVRSGARPIPSSAHSLFAQLQRADQFHFLLLKKLKNKPEVFFSLMSFFSPLFIYYYPGKKTSSKVKNLALCPTVSSFTALNSKIKFRGSTTPRAPGSNTPREEMPGCSAARAGLPLLLAMTAAAEKWMPAGDKVRSCEHDHTFQHVPKKKRQRAGVCGDCFLAPC